MTKYVLYGLTGAGLICLVCLALAGLFLYLLIKSDSAPGWYIRWENEARATRLKKAAENGNAEAMREYGTKLFSGIGAGKNKEEAVKWFQKATDNGDVEAHCRLANCFARGEGIPEDKSKAMEHYRLAAEKGSCEGQWKLGMYYMRGIATPRDDVEAAKWFRKSAEQDYYYAQYLIGRCYFEGTGVPKDNVEAAKWLSPIRWYDDAEEILKEIASSNPREPNPNWAEELRRNPTPPIKK